MKKTIILGFLILGSLISKAQQSLKVGGIVNNVVLTNVDDRLYSLNEQRGVKGFILAFISNTCEHCIAYKSRIIALDQKYKTLGYPLVAIAPFGDDPIRYPADAMPEMKKWAAAQHIQFPYLSDNQFKYTTVFGVKVTPTVVVLEKVKNGYQIKYVGRIDDNPDLTKDKTVKFVEMELDKLIQKK